MIPVDLEKILLSYYIRYDKMTELFYDMVSCNSSPIVDIYIDLNNYFLSIYKSELMGNNNSYVNKRFVIVSQVINLAAHIRGYFRDYCGKYTRIFLCYCDNSNNNHTRFHQCYNDDTYKTALDYNYKHELIESQLELVRIIAAYLQDIYFIKKTCDFTTFVYHNNKENILLKPTIVFSKDVNACLLCGVCENLYIARPKKYRHQDLSYRIDRDNVLSILYGTNNPNIRAIPAEMLNYVYIMNSNKNIGINRLCNITSIINILYNAIMDNKILPQYNTDPVYVYNVLQDLHKYCSLEEFCNRFYAIDIPYQDIIYSNTIESLDISWRINLKDPEALKNIANQYFIDNPLDLVHLKE